MGAPSPDVIRAIAAERGQPYEAVAAEFGVPPALALDAPAIEQPPPVAAAPPPEPVQAPPAAPPPEAAPAEAPPVEQPPAPPLDVGTAVADLDQLTQQQSDAALQIGEAEAQAAEREVARRDEWSRDADAIAKKHDTLETAAEEMQRESFERFRKLNAEIEASPEIRDRRTSSQRVWGAIALALSGWSEGMSGGTNNAVGQVNGIIQASVERDIAMQQANLAKKRKSAEDAQSEYGIARQYLGDTREARDYAMAVRKERFANDMGREAAQLTSTTARARATQVAAQFKVEAKKEQIDLLKKVMGGKMSALEAAMLVKLGVLSPEQARGQMGVPSGDAGAAPSSLVPGQLTKTQKGAVDVATYQNEVPGLTWLVDPSKVSKEDREVAQKIKSANDRVVRTVGKAREAYLIAADKSKPEDERLAALGRYRNLVYSQLPGFVSQATGSGTPQEGEAQRLLTSLPPVPVVNDVAGARGALQSLENWAGDRTMNPAGFGYFMQDFGDIVNSGLEAYKARLGADVAEPEKPKAAPAPGAKPKAGGKKPAVATSPEDFD